MALAALTAQQAQQLAQGGDKFIFTNDASTGQSLGGAHIPASQVQNLAALTGGIVPENLTFSNGRIYAADANGSMVDVTPYVDMSSYLPHDQTNQVEADSLGKTMLKFGSRAAMAYGAAAGLGALSGSIGAATGAGAGAGTGALGAADGLTFPGESIMQGAGTYGLPETAWGTVPTAAANPNITGDAGDWVLDGAGTPIPSGASITPAGAILPAGEIGPVGTVPASTIGTPGSVGVVGVPGGITPGGAAIPPAGATPVPTGSPGVAPGKVATDAAGNIDWGKVIAGIVSAFGASNMADAYKETADKYMKLGQPSRDRYEASFAPGFTMMNDPGYKDAMDSVGKESAAAMSMHGNPADSPNAWKQTQLDVYNKVAYPALQGYRQTNASAGGLASFASAVPAADTAAVGAQQNIWNAGGSIANNLFSPPQQNNSFDWQKFAKSIGLA